MAFGHISDIFSNIYLYYFSFDLFILWKKLSNNWWFQSNWSCESLRAAQDPPPFPRSDSGAQYGYILWWHLQCYGMLTGGHPGQLSITYTTNEPSSRNLLANSRWVKRLSQLNCTVIWRCLKPHAESPSHRFCGYESTPLFSSSAVAILHTRVRFGFDLVAIGSLHWMMTNPTADLLWQGRWEPEPLPWSCRTSLHWSCQS